MTATDHDGCLEIPVEKYLYVHLRTLENIQRPENVGDALGQRDEGVGGRVEKCEILGENAVRYGQEPPSNGAENERKRCQNVANSSKYIEFRRETTAK